MAESATVTIVGNENRNFLRVATIAWVSAASGSVTQTLDGASLIEGTIERVVYNPGATAPTAGYDVVLSDQDGVDVLNSTGINLSATVTSSTVVTEGDGTTNFPMATKGALALAIADAGAAKIGVVRIYFRT